MGDSPAISPPFLMESGHPNREAEVREEFLHKDTMCDLNTQQYQHWVDEDEGVDLRLRKEESWESLSRSQEKSFSLMPFEKDFLPLQPSPGGNQALTITNNEESDDDLDLPRIKHLSHTGSAKASLNKSQQSSQPLSTLQNTDSSLCVSKKPGLFRSLQRRDLPLVYTSSQLNRKRKRHAKRPINMDSDSGNERSHVKRQKEKFSMAKAVVEGKRIDAKIQRKDQELRAAQAD